VVSVNLSEVRKEENRDQELSGMGVVTVKNEATCQTSKAKAVQVKRGGRRGHKIKNP